MSDQIVNYDVDYSKWNVKQCLKDVVWLLMVDEPDEDMVKKGSLFIQTSTLNKNAFRIGLVMKTGPKVETLKEGDYVIIPPTVGVYGHKSHDGHKTWFVPENAVISVIEFDGSKEEMIANIKETLHLGQ
jgi:hypothetical protein